MPEPGSGPSPSSREKARRRADRINEFRDELADAYGLRLLLVAAILWVTEVTPHS